MVQISDLTGLLELIRVDLICVSLNIFFKRYYLGFSFFFNQTIFLTILHVVFGYVK
jgi:hypothetical protein